MNRKTIKRFGNSGLAVLLWAALLVAVPAPVAAQPPADQGYWMVASDGGVFTFGDAPFKGSMGGRPLARPIVGMAPAPSGIGYWMVASDGGIFSFGDSDFHGSTGGMKLNRPVVGMAASPSGRGYWFVASDGGIFAFGDSRFFGSTGGMILNQPIVEMIATPTGRGYWLVASDGGVFTFGDATFLGSMGGKPLARPIVGMARTPSGKGYWLVSSDGGIFAFGDAAFFGSTGGINLNRPIVAIAPTPSARGYWMFASDGGVFTFGDAAFLGGMGGQRLAAPVVDASSFPNRAGPRVSIFFYPWFANPEADGQWRHWDQGGHSPPDDIGSNFYPVRDAYSSSVQSVLDAQMREIAAAGVDEVITSWWGRSSFEDARLPQVRDAAAAAGLSLAAILEPYSGRTATTAENDIGYLRAFGISDFYVYNSTTISAASWAGVTNRIQGVRVFGHGSSSALRNGTFAAFAQSAGFDGIFTYDPLVFQPSEFESVCGFARARSLLCSPSVSPGYNATRATSDTRVKSRRFGDTYVESWRGAIEARADIVTITSYNEWAEGSQIEPAKEKCIPGFCYESYQGAYGKIGTPSETAYLDRTRDLATNYRAEVRF